MASKSTSYCMVFLLAGFLAACSSSSNPAGPSGTTGNDNPGTNTPPPSSSTGRTGSVSVTVNPNPVPFSGKPITDVAGCARRNNTWYYELTLKESSGAPVTFTTQIDAFDGFVVNNLTGVTIQVPANGEVKLNPRWCSSTSGKHTAQHTFSYIDSAGNAINVQSPLVNLMANTGK
ncbi:MAG TPA: hypothetical protein VFO48_08930 [Vicinamibacterales bacterium]|nr:hypothetical protein [Vicinamibacterales bacterium]